MAVGRARAGFTIAEVTIAAILIGLIAFGIAKLLGASTVTAREERHRMQATLIATSELARLRAIGPQALAEADTFRADRFGQPREDGEYEVTIDTSVRCEGGLDPRDNANLTDPFAAACVDERGIAVVHVTVRYPTDTDPLGGRIAYELAFGASGVHADQAGAR